MKKLLILFLLVLGTTFAFAQQSDLKTKTFHLDNGLKVVMCEDHSQPEIYGAVYVHVGSKNDPVDATGMAFLVVSLVICITGSLLITFVMDWFGISAMFFGRRRALVSS